jgi:hypothetical protein
MNYFIFFGKSEKADIEHGVAWALVTQNRRSVLRIYAGDIDGPDYLWFWRNFT